MRFFASCRTIDTHLCAYAEMYGNFCNLYEKRYTLFLLKPHFFTSCCDDDINIGFLSLCVCACVRDAANSSFCAPR